MPSKPRSVRHIFSCTSIEGCDDLLIAMMDAPDDNRDIKLYRASADLLPEISRRLDELLTGISNAGNPPAHQPWIADSQTQKLISLVSNFPVDASKILC